MIILILTDMDSSLYAFIMLYLCLVLRPVTGHQCGNLSLPATITIPETTTPGTPIYELNSTGTETGTKPWTLQNTEYFQFSYQSSIYQLTLTKKIDVNCQKERLFTLDFTCGNQSKVMVVTVPFTDKNVPTWITSNINKNLELNESLLLGTPVLDLDGAVDDRDCYKDGNIIEVARYTAVNQHDASSFFSYNATSKQVYLSRVFDYDEMYCDFNFKLVHGVLYFNLKLYPDNDPKSISQEKITVNFTDVDDEPPVFLKYKGCKECLSKCKSTSQSHTIRLERDIQSNLTFETMAKDFDTEEEDLEYTIIEVIPDYLLNYVDIDSQNGTVNLQISEGIIGSGNDTVKLDQINIVLQVRERYLNQSSDNLTLTLTVLYPTTTTTTSTTTTTQEPTTTFDLTTEKNYDLQTNMTETPVTNIVTTTEDSATKVLSTTTPQIYSTSSAVITQSKAIMTTSSTMNTSETNSWYDKTVETALMIVVIVLGGLIALVIVVFITYKCMRPKGSRNSYVMQLTSVESKL
ncbi:uncharacterized protein [Argopecten irradians]|uniref:uncharacterized protein isoform X2 n=1 Tax=Argopecten irradians TaxID=31199 RepID=UPI0037216FD3